MNGLIAALMLTLAMSHNSAGQRPYDKCDLDYLKGGCFIDDPDDRALPVKLIVENDPDSPKFSGNKFNWKNFTASVAGLACRCAAKAREEGFKYFGLQSYGVCWAGNSGFDKYGEADPKYCVQNKKIPCNEDDDIPCVGRKGFNYAYMVITSVDGGWGPWSAWSRCSKKCTMERVRKCNMPKPEGHGMGCNDYEDGHFKEVQNCFEDDCDEEEWLERQEEKEGEKERGKEKGGKKGRKNSNKKQGNQEAGTKDNPIIID